MRVQTIDEKKFAKIVGLSYGYIKTLRRKGLINYIKVGRAVRYCYPEHVELFLKRHEQITA